MSELFSLIARQDMESFLEFQKLYHHEMAELTKRKIKKILEQNYQLSSLGEFHIGLQQIIKSNDGKLKLKLAKEHNNGWLWITISPKPSIKFEDFRKKMDKLANRKMFNGVEYAFEQRGISIDNVHGWHCHMLAKRNLNYKPYNCKKNIKNTVKTLVDNVEHDNKVNIQIIGDDFAVDKEQYFKGLKYGEGKDEKQKIDKIWRINIGLEPYYSIAPKN